MTDYEAFLASKAVRAAPAGMTVIPKLAPHLFGYQSHCTDFALRTGRSAMFLDTGLGKTETQLEFLHQSGIHTKSPTLMLTPLAVAGQAKRRADRWGYEARVIRSQDDVGEGINICNYDRLHLLDTSAFGAVSLDESSCLKAFTGKTTSALISAFSDTPFRMAATATPAPNDYTELGNHAAFLGVIEMREMLSRWFINDTSTASQDWRLKKHAEADFWDWVGSWARCAEFPSDLGGEDAGFILPPVNLIRHKAERSAIKSNAGDMLGLVSVSATNMHAVKRATSEARADTVASIVSAEPSERWLIWCDSDYEADALKSKIPDAIEVRGSHSADIKEDRLEAFGDGRERVLITKPTLAGFGLDWSHCARMVFVGRSYSYETFYQAVRRCHRFGQARQVDVHLVVAEGEDEIGRVIERKTADHARMKGQMREAMRRSLESDAERMVHYNPIHKGRVPSWLK
jgi:hypothetical protein